MRIQKSLKKAVDEIVANDYESAMLHVCNAIDGTAQKKYGGKSSRTIYTKFLRDHYDLICALTGLPQLNLKDTIWPVTVERTEKPDFAEMIYGVHRCGHNHGAEVPEGFAFYPDTNDPLNKTTLKIQNGSVGLSDRFIWALITIVVLDPVNNDLRLLSPELDGYYLTIGKKRYLINEWWGKLDDFPKLPLITSKYTFDFTELR